LIGTLHTWRVHSNIQLVFIELFIIHGLKNGHYINPLIFCLLPEKTTEIYTNAFQLIVDKCSTLSVQLLPQHITTDFEKSKLNAIHEIWPQT